jgi:hypothetical protein
MDTATTDVAGDIVWQSVLDGRYTALVVRRAQFRGVLELWYGAKLLLQREVGLAYGAIGGPNVENVQAWQKICTQFIENWTRKFFCACCKKEVPRKDLHITEDMPEKVLCKRCASPWGDYIGMGLVSAVVLLIIWAALKVFGVL